MSWITKRLVWALVCSLLLPTLGVAEEIFELVETNFTVRAEVEAETRRHFLSVDFNDSDATSATILYLHNPPRIVVDVSNVSEFATGTFDDISDLLLNVRLAEFENAQRIVFDFPEKATVRVLQELQYPEGLFFDFTVTPEGVPEIPIVNEEPAPIQPEIEVSPVEENEPVFIEQPPISETIEIPQNVLPEEPKVTAVDNSAVTRKLNRTKTVQRRKKERTTLLPFQRDLFRSMDQETPQDTIPASGSALWLLVLGIGICTASLFFIQAVFRHKEQIDTEDEPAPRMETQIITLPSLREAYRILGCARDANDTEIKARYRHLVKVFHHDALHPKELPGELLEISRTEFERVRAAFSRLKLDRPGL